MSRDGCSGKVRHPSLLAAQITLKRLRNKGLNVYRCSICGSWHLGNSSKPWKIVARLDQLLGARR